MEFVKQGPRVTAEAEALAVGHPGVVELVDVVDGALRTRRVEGRSLEELDRLDPDEVAGVAAAVATTLADLHDAGVVHGGVEAGHVLVADDGRIVLCSLGRGGEPADDVAALGHLVRGLLATATAGGSRRPAAVPARRWGGAARWAWWREPRPARLGALLAPPAGPVLAKLAADATAAETARRPTARQLAAEVHQRVPTARLPVLPSRGPALALLPAAAESAADGRRRVRVLRPGRALVVAGVVGPLVVLGLLVPGVRRALPGGGTGGAPAEGRAAAAPPRAPSTTTGAGVADGGESPATRPAAAAAPGASAEAPAPAAEPVAEQVWPPPPVAFADGVLTMGAARYAVGRPGDAVVAGDWACTGERTIALLRPASGEVFAFDGWPEDGRDVEARALGRVRDAAALRLVDGDGDGCDDLQVERPGRPPVRLAVRPAATPDRGDRR